MSWVGALISALFLVLYWADLALVRPTKPRRGQAAPVTKAIPPQIPATPTAEKPEPSRAPQPVGGEQITKPPKPEPQIVSAVPEVESAQGVFLRIKSGLRRTHDQLVEGIADLVKGQKKIDEEVLEEIEAQLLMADLGVEATQQVIQALTQSLQRKDLADTEALYAALKAELQALLKPCAQPLQIEGAGPFVILMVGVNGAGKTTTIGKLAKQFQNQGLKVMLAAGDTFRAAAVEQLQEWGRRNEVPVVAQQTGADSASVIFDALESARARKIDVLIADTAGRLQNKDNLMAELSKIKRVMAKLDERAPHEVMLVLDAGTGQNALSQAKLFNEAVGVTGITLTKLDGTAKGGVIFAVAKQMQLPIRFIGVGEKIDDLRVFEADQFVAALFD